MAPSPAMLPLLNLLLRHLLLFHGGKMRSKRDQERHCLCVLVGDKEQIVDISQRYHVTSSCHRIFVTRKDWPHARPSQGKQCWGRIVGLTSF